MKIGSIAEVACPNAVIVDSIAELLSDMPELKIDVRRPNDQLVEKYWEQGYQFVIMLDPRVYCMVKEVEPNIFRVLKFNGNNDFEAYAEDNRKI